MNFFKSSTGEFVNLDHVVTFVKQNLSGDPLDNFESQFRIYFTLSVTHSTVYFKYDTEYQRDEDFKRLDDRVAPSKYLTLYDSPRT